MRKKHEIQISEAELTAMTRDLDEMHRATLPKMHEAIAELREGGSTRRGFLVGAAGLTAGALIIAACGSDNSNKPAAGGTASAGTGGSGEKLTGDLAIAALAASLENLAVNTYQAGLDAATAGKL